MPAPAASDPKPRPPPSRRPSRAATAAEPAAGPGTRRPARTGCGAGRRAPVIVRLVPSAGIHAARTSESSVRVASWLGWSKI